MTLQKEMKREREDTRRGRGWTGRRKRRQTEGVEGEVIIRQTEKGEEIDRERGGGGG